MIESSAKRKIVRQVKAAGGYARRLEDKYTVGMPDLIVAFRNTPCFLVEVKMVEGQAFAPTTRQFIEMEDMAKRSNIMPLMVGVKDGLYYFHRLANQAILSRCIVSDNFVDGIHRWLRHVPGSKDTEARA